VESHIDTTETSFRSTLLWVIFLLTGYLSVLSTSSDLYSVASGQTVVFLEGWRSSVEAVPGRVYISLWAFVIDFGIKLAPVVIVLFLYLFGPLWIARRHRLVDLGESFPEKARLIRNLIRDSGFEEHIRLYASDDDRLNCFTFGRGDRLGIAFTRGLLETLEDDEVKATASHELGHILNRDVWVVTLASTFVDAYKYYILVFCAYEAWNMAWLTSGWLAHMGWYDALIQALLRYAPDFFILIPTFLIPLLLVSSLSRSREILADATSSLLVGSPLPLNSALMKIYSSHYAGPSISSRLAIAGRETSSTKNPLEFLGNLFRTHPTLERRQTFLLDSVYGRIGSRLPSGEAVSWLGLTLAFVVLTLVAETTSVANLVFGGPYIFLTRLQGWVSAYYFGIEVVMPLLVIVGLFSHYYRKTRSSLFAVWRKIASASLAYSLFFTVLVMILYLAEELLGHIMMARFSPARAEYIEWIFEYVRVVFPRLDLLIFTRSELYMTPTLPMIGCILVGTFILVITTSLFMLLTMTRRMLGFSLELSRIIQRSVSKRSMIAAFMVALLVGSSYLILSISRKSREDLSIQWLMSSFRRTSVYENSTGFVDVFYFEPDDVETNFYAVEALERLGRLGELMNDPNTVAGFSRFLSRLQTHEGGFRYSNFPDSPHSVEYEFYTLSVLGAIHRMNAIDREGALRYALKIPLNESVSSSHYALLALKILNHIEEIMKPQVEKFLVSSQYLEIRIPHELQYHGGFGEGPDRSAKLSSTYFAVATLSLIHALNQTNLDAIVSWTMKHYTGNGGFSEDLNFYSTYTEDDRTISNVVEATDATLQGTFYAVKILESLGMLHLVDDEKVSSYILGFQRRTGGFSLRTSSDEATTKDMYMAIEALASLGRIRSLEESFPLTATLHNLLQDIPLLPLAIVLGLAVAIITREYLKKIRWPGHLSCQCQSESYGTIFA